MRKARFALRLALCIGALAAPLSAAEPASTGTTDDLTAMSLEDLMNVEVTSVSKRPQSVSTAPAAVTVITSEDIEHSGLQSIPELMRLVPGMSVARIDANKWAISARGFNEQYASKLLGLMDGRSIYRTNNSGIWWDMVDYPIADIDRIEVIRGPGATLWGSNAVNGVINIITKDARDTQGLLFQGTASNVDNNISLRYGGKFNSEQTYYRVWGKFMNYPDFENNTDPSTGLTISDGWQATRGGFRVDHIASAQDTLTFVGSASVANRPDIEIVHFSNPPGAGIEKYQDHGDNLQDVLARWTHVVDERSSFQLQAYYDRTNRTHFGTEWIEENWDLDFQHVFALGAHQSITWGVGYRYIWESQEGTDVLTFHPPSRGDDLVTAFIQDDVTIVPERLHFIFGSKFEHGGYSGTEIQPSARLIWTPNNRHTVWGAVSRAIRTPNTSEQDLDGVMDLQRGPGGIPIEIAFMGDDSFQTEKLTAFELGYRTRLFENVTVDVAAFYNRHKDLRSLNPGAPAPTPETGGLVVPISIGNGFDADSYGVEIATNINFSSRWRVSASYSFLNVDATQDPSSTDPNTKDQLEHGVPRNQFQIHSYYQLSRNWDFDASIYYVDNLSAYDVPSQTRVDLAVAWHPKEDLTLKVGVQNLLDNQHPEFGDTFSPPTEMPRTVFAQLTWAY